MHTVYRVSVLAAALLSVMGVTTEAVAADSHFLGTTANIGMIGNRGFDVSPGIADRAIYATGSGASYMFGGSLIMGQFVFMAPYTGSGFVAPPGPAAALEGVVIINGVNGLGIDDQVNQQITLGNQVTLGGSQTWQISSATGSIRQLSSAAAAKRSLKLGISMLTLDAVNAANFFQLDNVISGTGGIIKTGAGSAILTGTNTYSGGTFFNGGTVSVAADANLGAATGVLAFNGGVLQVTGTTFTSTARTIQWGDAGGGFDIQDATNNFTLNQALTGTGQFTKLGAGTLTLSGTNTYTGITTIQAGTLALTGAGSIAGSSGVQDDGVLDITGTTAGASIQTLAGAGAVTLGAQTLNLTAAHDTFSGSFAGTGGLTLVSGTETLTGTANDAFTGTTTVQGGTLAVDGILANSAVSVLDGATLAGTGTVGSTSIAKGGTIAPGHSIGTLSVHGDFQQAAGSTYQVELNPGSNASDLIAVDGVASIANGAVLNVTKTPPGDYRPGAIYTVLSATGGVDGTYSLAGDTAPLSAFLGVKDSYDANHVYLKVTQTRDPGAAAQTPNQGAVAGGVDSLQPTSPVQGAVLNSPTDADARSTFDQLSGEAQASTKGVLVSNSVLVRNIAIDRLREVSCADDPRRTTTSQNCLAAAGDVAVWAQAMGGQGNAKDGSVIAKISQSSGGLLVGSDLTVAEAWRAGVFGGYSHTSFDVNARRSSGESKSYHFGGYAGTQWGSVVLSTGASYTWNDIRSHRRVSYGMTTDRLEANYDAGTAQAFGELGYRADVGRGILEPFVNLAYVSLKTDGFRETGGDSALSSHGDTTENTITTLGIRPSTSLSLGKLEATFRGMLGWRHAFGDVRPTSTVAFAGGDAFTVEGAPIAKNATVAEVGADLLVARRTTIGLTYAGQFGSGNTDQSLRASITTQF